MNGAKLADGLYWLQVAPGEWREMRIRNGEARVVVQTQVVEVGNRSVIGPLHLPKDMR